MDKLRKAGESLLTGMLAVTFLFVVFFMVSNQEYKELEVSSKKPKYPMKGVMSKTCVKYGFKCPVTDRQVASHGDWVR